MPMRDIVATAFEVSCDVAGCKSVIHNVASMNEAKRQGWTRIPNPPHLKGLPWWICPECLHALHTYGRPTKRLPRLSGRMRIKK